MLYAPYQSAIPPYFYMVRVVYSITVNVAARRLTVFKDGAVFKSYPVAVGKPSTPTPKGTFKVKNKAVNPGGPFGVRWLGITAPGGGYGIHGTNNPSSIGQAVSNGCVRMHNRDILEIFPLIPIGATVRII